MTNDEIIKFLQSKQIPQCGDKEYTANEEYEAYQRAIDALDQQPCDDAISRKTLLTNLYQYKISYAGRIQAAILEVEELVEKMPPVTPQQKYGHWEWVQYNCNPKLGNWQCSECKSIVIECVDKEGKGGIPLYKYCPQCGIEIQESEDKE